MESLNVHSMIFRLLPLVEVDPLAKLWPAMEPHVRSLLDAMFSTGLSSTLVSIPLLLPTIQGCLLDSISVALSRTLYSHSRTSLVVTRGNVINNPNQASELSCSALMQLALQTLSHYNFFK
ncbi:hypothetical protein MKW94_027552, partial [Papaver nudicaule]|nr:hypothetical protein [Papaver nudicaule]